MTVFNRIRIVSIVKMIPAVSLNFKIQRDDKNGDTVVQFISCREVVNLEKMHVPHTKLAMYTRPGLDQYKKDRKTIMAESTKYTDPELMEGVMVHVREAFKDSFMHPDDIYTFKGRIYEEGSTQ